MAGVIVKAAGPQTQGNGGKNRRYVQMGITTRRKQASRKDAEPQRRNAAKEKGREAKRRNGEGERERRGAEEEPERERRLCLSPSLFSFPGLLPSCFPDCPSLLCGLAALREVCFSSGRFSSRVAFITATE